MNLFGLVELKFELDVGGPEEGCGGGRLFREGTFIARLAKEFERAGVFTLEGVVFVLF